ncbi:phosphotransferase enzyme family protein [Microdochium trichocladiopsis]|uniref:Phosphotransferase enzyme family protein n=1 Tax=Microdochium trichocladiopsis TaxID=1682393 RepID=A0A9P8Y7U2_9PEZI|nr:phosphotransferase enzyme family protein [Microdochium trichocladiopsis]KAH7030591.1 phosphotransferase enzyme family protein [Microdochium trichocladiopsis]
MAGRVRQPIDVGALEAYLCDKISGFKGPLEVKQFGFGQSNPTYQLVSGTGTKYVMRKKPPGKLLSTSAHQVEREYRILHALAGTDVPVPAVYCLCEDTAVIGTAFYVMEFLDGRIIEDAAMLEYPAQDRSLMWQSAVETLAKLHRIDYKALGLDTFGKSSGFYNRQLKTWQITAASQEKAVDVDTGEPVGSIPHFPQLLAYFAREQPRDRATIVHGDFKIDNLVFHKTEPRVIGVLDWEMSTIGHPLSDLCGLLGVYYTTDADVEWTMQNRAFKAGCTPGLPTVDGALGQYAAVAEWDPKPDMQWAMAFSMMRGAVICQGIAARAARRQASSEEAKRYADSFVPMAEYSWALVQRRAAEKGIEPGASKL